MASHFIPIGARIGARGTATREELLHPAFARECLDALERYGVLVFPRISLNDEQQLEFSGRLGEMIPLGKLRPDGSRDPIFKVSLDPNENTSAEYLKGTIHWHIASFQFSAPRLSFPKRISMLAHACSGPVGSFTESRSR